MAENMPVRSQRERRGRPRSCEAIAWPSDTEIWDNRRRTFAWWARRLGVCDRTVREVFTRRGWRRFANGAGRPGPLWAVRQAPCEDCGLPFEVGVEGMQSARLCWGCRPEAMDVASISDRALTYAEEKALAFDRMRRRRRAALDRVRFADDGLRQVEAVDRREPWRDAEELGDWGDRAFGEVA
jgi:hypothetical protein